MRATSVNLVNAVIAVAVLAGCSAAASPPASASLPAASTQASAAAPSASAVSLAETLQGGTWRMISATGTTEVDRLSPVEFREGDVVGLGVCGFSSNVAYPAAGAIDVVELGWDSVRCGDTTDSRVALAIVLDAVTAGRVSGDGSVTLAGPGGEVVLTR